MPNPSELERQKPAVIESMTTILLPYATVRVWRAEEEVGEYDNSDLREAASKQWQEQYRDVGALALKLVAMPRVNAVEVKDSTGCGVVLYSEWP